MYKYLILKHQEAAEGLGIIVSGYYQLVNKVDSLVPEDLISKCEL